jgi:intracellular sulfur oxidation DsrE/DsrF family protein
MKHTLLKTLIFTLSILVSSTAYSNDVETILSQKEAPTGVVFEIVSGDSDLLAELLPAVKMDIKKLRDRFPEIHIAIVTHGTEQFALTKNNQTTKAGTHKQVQALVSDDVDVHVCGTHAGWYGVTPEDFPDYVNVSATGPAQINDYKKIGYEVIVLP